MQQPEAFADLVKWDILEYINGQGLDIGCGDARPHDWMVGIDKVPGKTGRGPNLVMDGTKLTFADESQDFVFSSYCLQEIDDIEAAIREWWRVIKPFGYLILFLPINVKINAKTIIDVMQKLQPFQAVDIREANGQLFHVYRKCNLPMTLMNPKPEKVCAVMKLGAHGDALWASSVLPQLKAEGYHIKFYTQDTGFDVLRNDPHIDHMIKFESRVPQEQLGELCAWLSLKYPASFLLLECVEGTLLPAPGKVQYHFPHDMRHKLMNYNYLDMHHIRCGFPTVPRQKFYPSEEEKAIANEFRAKLKPFVVVLVPNGSSVSKMWPYTPNLVKRLLERNDVSVVMLGDERGMKFEEHPDFHKIGMAWPIRQAMTFCQLANVVCGQETGLLNAVAFEPHIRKVVLLTHSTVENLTRDWPNTQALSGAAPCYPCHRLHYDWTHCKKNELTQASQCQTLIRVNDVHAAIAPGLQPEAQAKAA